MQDRNAEQVAGLLLVGSLVAFYGHVVTFLAGQTRPTVFLVMVYGFLIFASAPAIYLAFRPHRRILALVGGAGSAAHGLLVVVVGAVLLAQVALTRDLQPTALAEDDPAVLALDLTMDAVRSSAFVFLGVGLAALGTLIVRSRAVVGWVGWWGVSCGLIGVGCMLGRLLGVVNSLVVAVVVINLMFGFMLILGIRLLASQIHGPPSELRRPPDPLQNH